MKKTIVFFGLVFASLLANAQIAKIDHFNAHTADGLADCFGRMKRY